MSMNPSISVAPVSGRKWFGSWAIPVLGVALVAAGGLALKFWPSRADGGVSGQFFTVLPMDLEVKINKDGELQAISYTDIKSEVETSTQIISLIQEGATVKKGDVLIKLDGSALQTRKETLELDLKKAESNVKIALEMKEIQVSQNSANTEAAEVALELAQLDLKQFTEGTYPQTLENARTALKMANLTLKNKDEELDQTKTLFGKGFVTAADVKKSEVDVTMARNELQKATTALMVLEKYARAMDLAKLRSAEAQADQKLARTIKENASTLTQKLADLDEKQHALDLLKRQMKKLQEQIDACTIRAPEDGLVIYASSIDRNQRDQIQEGTSVRQSQWLLRLPDIRSLKAALKIQESQKTKLDETKEQRALVKILGYPTPIGATLTKVSVLPDNAQRWWNPDLREYPVELTLDDTLPGLKPGMRVDAEIFVSRLDGVLATPLSCIYTVGRQSFVFVKTSDGVRERKVVLGIANETHVQIESGLVEAEEVLLLQPGQGRFLLEKAGIKLDEPTTRPSREGPPRRGGRGGRGPDNADAAKLKPTAAAIAN